MLKKLLGRNRGVSFGIIIYCLGFFLLVSSKMIERSALLTPPDYVYDVMEFAATFLFGIKFLLDKHGKKELLISILIMSIAVILRLLTGWPTALVASVFAFLSIRGVDIKTIIKIDLAVKVFFLITHAFVFVLDYAMGFELAADYIGVSAKGASASLYFMNPNSTGLIGTFIAIDMLYLKNHKRLRDYIMPTIIALLTFVVTLSRTPFSIYIVYLMLQFIKDGKILTVIQKGLFPLLFLVSFMIVEILPQSGTFYDLVNGLLSGRLSHSIYAYDMLGVNVLPNMLNFTVLEKHQIIVDVFYVRCMVQYGLITIVLYYIPHLLLPLRSNNEQKRMSIIASLYLFFEIAISNVGFAAPYLILADAIYNLPRKDKMEKSNVC